MRADRLLSLLMLLQRSGGMTAQELAEELEVSVRTIYRDLTALNTSGVPVYAERGPGGGCFLLDGYRTDLTGLSPLEVRALFMLSIPASLDELGVGQELKAALLKLSAALPSSRREDEERTRQRIHLDPSPWFQVENPMPHLHTVHEALWQDRKLHLKYVGQHYAPALVEVERVLTPYGLVAKADDWYLVGEWNTTLCVLRVSRITCAELLAETFTWPSDFDLVKFWNGWCARSEAQRSRFPVTARILSELMDFFPGIFGHRLKDIEILDTQRDPDGWVTVTIPFETFESARSRVLGLGGAIEVLEPVALRLSVMDYAEQISRRYQSR